MRGIYICINCKMEAPVEEFKFQLLFFFPYYMYTLELSTRQFKFSCFDTQRQDRRFMYIRNSYPKIRNLQYSNLNKQLGFVNPFKIKCCYHIHPYNTTTVLTEAKDEKCFGQNPRRSDCVVKTRFRQLISIFLLVLHWEK